MAIEQKTVECCTECLKTVEQLEAEQGFLDTIYEYECGNQFSKEEEDTHRCPDCGHFASKLTDRGCTECYAEVEEIEVWQCLECSQNYQSPSDAYGCCSEKIGEIKPPAVIDEEEAKVRAKEAKIKAEADKMERLWKEYPPKYQIGDIIKDIDLGSRGTYNHQAFVDAKVIALKPLGGSMGGTFRWQYALAQIGKEAHTALCDENNIEYQTGSHIDSREYRWCCPYTTVHAGEHCKRCGKSFEDISTEKRSL